MTKNLKYLIALILAVAVGYLGFLTTKTSLGRPSTASNNQSPTTVPTSKPVPSYPQTIGNFLVTDNEVCLEEGKPLVYFFGSSTCPHCEWEKPIAKKVFDEFKNEITYHENYDSQADAEVFQKYSDINPGYIPFLVLGCKYVRIGAGENLGKDDAESKTLEEEALKVILCKVTGGKPGSVCDSLKDELSEVK